ncbi:hypothetical protein [Comamonas thiooxydans]|uniref:hypothetical protein n=1 Tax=Comamonas thiooxydans TaxID=363952 RepID=UPI00050FFE6B|nr:hypothetical protein [Comamonas thiooxydans]KGH24060.1 hypothetical protein P606_10190 [Comamonas thiooxydans]
MKLYLIAAAVCLVASTINAAPVYLDCTSLNQHSGKTTNYKITVDETAQTATFSDDGLTNGKSFTRPAQFAQTDVKYSWTIPGLGFTLYYRIDRTDMGFSQNFMGNPEKTDHGSCKIAQPVTRQF